MTRALADDEYTALQQWLQTAAGLVFDPNRRGALDAIVADRLLSTGCAKIADYLAFIDSPTGSDERQRLLDDATIQETYFFRNPPQADALRGSILPELVRRAAGRLRPLTIWSAGCSTGEEPYTLAMMLLELSADSSDARVAAAAARARILGTDVSRGAIDAAKRATYSARSTALVSAQALARFFDTHPDGRQQVRRPVRDLVDLRRHNLVTDSLPLADGSVDLVVCRNVTIYFSRETTRRLVSGWYRALAPGGYLLLGHSETLWQLSDRFTLVPVGAAFAYRKEPTVRRRRPVASPLNAPLTPPKPLKMPTPPYRPALLSAALQAHQNGRYAEAASLAGAVADDYPLLVEPHVLRGLALATLGDDVEALVALRRATYLDPGAGHAYFVMAGALARAGQQPAARRAYAAAAATLERVQSALMPRLLDGRAVAELADLARTLSRSATRAEPRQT